MKRTLLILTILNISNLFCSDTSSSSSRPPSSSSNSMPGWMISSSLSSTSSASMPSTSSSSSSSSSSSKSYDTSYSAYIERCKLNCIKPISRDQWDENHNKLIQLIIKEKALEIEELLKSGQVDINATTNTYERTSALIMAVSDVGYEDSSSAIKKQIVELLLREPGIKVDMKDIYGHTALMEASANLYADLEELLLKAGADVNLKDKAGKTALDHKKDRLEMEKMLCTQL